MVARQLIVSLRNLNIPCCKSGIAGRYFVNYPKAILLKSSYADGARKGRQKQEDIWIATSDLAPDTGSRFP